MEQLSVSCVCIGRNCEVSIWHSCSLQILLSYSRCQLIPDVLVDLDLAYTAMKNIQNQYVVYYIGHRV